MGWLLTLCLLCTLHLASSKDYLLPDDVIPSHYDVRLVYDVDPNTNYSFYGIVDILLSAKKVTEKIVLHAQDYLISNNKIKLSRGNEHIDISNVHLLDKYNILTITLDRQMEKDKNYILTIPFRGNLKHELNGVYVSTYENKHTKNKEYLIVTHFEPLGARKAFPCFDEPIYKATFNITIGHHRSLTSVSNMPLNKSSENNALEAFWPWHVIESTFRKSKSDFIFDEFDVSVPMSTYLVAFVVSKFTYMESPADLSTTKFRIWSRSDATEQTSYAAKIGPKILTYYETWFNVSFPLPKQDMIAIPDFALGAMENWGLITYRETALLYDKAHSSLAHKEGIANTVAHELAHQWFGNLVTMKWWSDLWLNEGFATFVATAGVGAVEPTWHANRSYSVNYIQSVLALDALESSHPVSVPIDDPKRIFEIFDEISYAKGATLIRMMSMFLGEEMFKKGIHNYLIKYSYRNAEQDDLWQMLTEASQQQGGLIRNISIKEIMDTWTTQTGYPLLTVTRDYNDTSLTIIQRRYLALNTRARTSASWWVPLSVMCEKDSGSTPLEWLGRDQGLARPHGYKHDANKDQWVLFNSDMIAPYRVNYDQQNWKLLSDTLRSSHYTDIPVLGRVQLLSDAFALAWTNHLGYDTTLELSSYLSRETDYLPLSIGLNGLHRIGYMLRRTADYGVFQKYVRKLIGDTYHQAGGMAANKMINVDDMEAVKMQILLGQWGCRMKVLGCEENAVAMFQKWMETRNPDENNPIPPDLRPTVYEVAMSRGSVAQWQFVLARKQRATSASAQRDLLLALTRTRDLWVIAQFLEWSVTDGSEVRSQDTVNVIAGLLQSTVGYYIAKDFVYNRIQDIYKTMNGDGMFLGAIISTLLSQSTTQKELSEFMAWRDQNSKHLEVAKFGVEQAIERAKVNINWINQNRRLVVDKLREFCTEEEEKHPVPFKKSRSFQAQTRIINSKVLFVTVILLYIV